MKLNTDSKSKIVAEQGSRDGGVSKAGRKRTKKVLDDDFVATGIPTTSLEKLATADGDTKQKATSDGVSRVGRKRKGKVSDEHKEIAPEEVDEPYEEVDSEENDTPPTKTKKTRKGISKDMSEMEDDKFDDGKDETLNSESVEGNATDTKPKKKRKPRTRDSEKNRISESHKVKQSSALEYLKQWHKRRQDWNFKKLHQIWLLQNMYKVTDAVFEVLLKYLENLQGGVLERTTQEAVTILENETVDESDTKSVRAREILYAMQDS